MAGTTRGAALSGAQLLGLAVILAGSVILGAASRAEAGFDSGFDVAEKGGEDGHAAAYDSGGDFCVSVFRFWWVSEKEGGGRGLSGSE